jgi:hypothetical protein
MAVLQLVDDQYNGMDAEAMSLHWLQAVADLKVLVCRSRARHGFESFGQTKRFRQTWALSAPWNEEAEGSYLVVQRCPDCTYVIRERLTGAGGLMDWPWRWRYHTDDRYKPPKGSARITPTMATREIQRRRDEDARARKSKSLVAELAGGPVPAQVLMAIGYTG